MFSHLNVNNNTRPLLVDVTKAEGLDNPRLLRRSKFNARDEVSSRSEYKASILEHGMNWDARSKVVTIAADQEDLELHMYEPSVRVLLRDVLAACHCCEAVLELWAEQPSHPQVKLAISQGALYVVDMKPGVPEVALVFNVL